MHNQVFPIDRVRKDRERARFVATSGQDADGSTFSVWFGTR